MKNQENVSKEYYLEGYIYLALNSQRGIALLVWCVQQSWTTFAGASPVTVIASELCS